MKCGNIVVFLIVFAVVYCGQQLSKDYLCINKATRATEACTSKKKISKSNCNNLLYANSNSYFQQCILGLYNSNRLCCFKYDNPTSVQSRKVGEISLKKCHKYSTIVKDQRKKCYHPNALGLVVGGERAHRMEFPHMAAIGYGSNISADNIWKCGGTLISRKFVLTAAHCVKHQDFGLAQYVKLGVNDLRDRQKNMQLIKIAKHIIHAQYQTNTKQNDIALLKLDHSARMDKYVRPACLYTKRNIKVESATATGWGALILNGNSNEKLMKVVLKIYKHKNCKSYWLRQRTRFWLRPVSVDRKSQICAGSSKNNEVKDTCQGDSGGPLQIYVHPPGKSKKLDCSMYNIIGITSYGKDCNGLYGLYTRVSHYIKWIEDIVWPEFRK